MVQSTFLPGAAACDSSLHLCNTEPEQPLTLSCSPSLSSACMVHAVTHPLACAWGCLKPEAECGHRRNELELCGRLLGVAGSGLNDNPGLLVFAVLALLAVACLWVPLVSFLGLSYANGSIRPNRAPAAWPAYNTASNLVRGTVRGSALRLVLRTYIRQMQGML